MAINEARAEEFEEKDFDEEDKYFEELNKVDGEGDPDLNPDKEEPAEEESDFVPEPLEE
jgi:hypothetical protein